MGIQNLPTAIQSIIQQNYLERAFEDLLRAQLGFRAIARRSNFPADIGETLTKTRPGLLAPVTTPLTPSSNTNFDNGLTTGNAAPVGWTVEQFTLSINSYGFAQDVNAVTDSVAIANVFMETYEILMEQALRSVDTLAQQALFNAYMGGNTRVRVTLGAAGTTISVDDVRGFQQTLNGEGQPVAISGSFPVNVQVNGDTYSLTGFTVDGTNVSTTPGGTSGTLTFSTNVTTTDGTAGNSVVSAVAPVVLRPSLATSGVMAGNTSAISSTNDYNAGKLSLSMLLAARATLRNNGVPMLNMGGFNLYADPTHLTGLYADPAFQQFFRGQIQSDEYRNGVIARVLGINIIETNLNPIQTLSGVGTVHRAILCGQSALEEGTFDEARYNAAERSAGGALSEIRMMDGIAAVIRPPMDRLSQLIGLAWNWIGGFTVPTDVTANPTTIPTASNSAYKRGVILQSL